MKFGGTLQQLLKPITVMWPTIEIFKIRDGGDGRLKKSLFWHNSSTDCPISAKFCTRKQDGMSTRATWQKLQTFEIDYGGRPPFWKSLNLILLRSTLTLWQCAAKVISAFCFWLFYFSKLMTVVLTHLCKLLFFH